MKRLEVREQVMLCEACELHTKGSGPIPFSGPTPAHVAIIGEAPGRQEDHRGEPFVGFAGQMLRELMQTVGLDPVQVFLANTVSCWPDATPTPDHVHACAHNLAAQLDLADPRWVVLVGGVALSSIAPHLKITRARRHVFNPPGRRRYLATVHPAYALRNRKGEVMLRDDLALLVQMMDAGDGWVLLASDDCVMCGVDVEDLVDHGGHLRFDNLGACYCDACWERFYGAAVPAKIKPAPTLPSEQVALFV